MVGELIDHFDMTDPTELQVLMEIKQSIQHNPNSFIQRLDKEIFEAAMKRELCPECFSPLKLRDAVEVYRVQGETFREPVTRVECPECGWRG